MRAVRYLTPFVLSFLLTQTFAQSELSLYRFNQTVPQAGLLNPSFIPDYKFVMGLPGFSHYAMADNDKLAFRDLFFRNENDSLVLDTLLLPAKLNGLRNFRMETESQLFLLGFRAFRFYFTLGSSLNTHTHFSYPGTLAAWALRGPADDLFEGQNLNIDDFSIDALAYHEYYVGVARSFGNKLSLGVRFRYLMGIASARSDDFTGFLHVDADSVTIRSSRITVNTGGVSFFDQDDLEIKDYVKYGFDSKNRGFAIDLGATYKVTNKLTVSAAINDLGYIQWKDYTRRYEIDPVNYTFRGFDIVDFIFDNNMGGIDDEIDSLENLYDAREVEGGTFNTPLSTKFYAGGTYQLGKHHIVGLVGYAALNRGKVSSALGLSYSLQLGRMVQAMVGGSYSNGKFNNLGAGLSLKLGPLQFYGTTDRGNGLVYPSRTSWANMHAGMNLVFGKVKKREEVPQDSAQTEMDSVVVEDPVEEQIDELVVEDTVSIEPIAPPMDTATVDTTSMAPVEIPQDTVSVVPVPVDTVTEVITPPVVVPVVSPPDTTRVFEEPRIDRPQSGYAVVKRGNHRDELPLGHYVIAGVFKYRENAADYSRQLQDAGFYNTFGYVSEKGAYYIQVYYSTDDLEAVRRARDQYRNVRRFQFRESWVLSIEE